jgi:hypothetical protein
LDHIGFEIAGLAAFCEKLTGMGITLDTPYSRGADGLATTGLTDPWGVSIALAEGLRGY